MLGLLHLLLYLLPILVLGLVQEGELMRLQALIATLLGFGVICRSKLVLGSHLEVVLIHFSVTLRVKQVVLGGNNLPRLQHLEANRRRHCFSSQSILAGCAHHVLIGALDESITFLAIAALNDSHLFESVRCLYPLQLLARDIALHIMKVSTLIHNRIIW